jgi:bifunctional UDP-N-acetylglucosamine pyrophosphorylase/glucosamine-1-phosphate N-acetyltransferase
MAEIHVVVLAAGKGTRMKSARPKVLHRVAGAPMIEHVLAVARHLEPASTTVVIGHEADALRSALACHAGLGLVVQEPQLGTAHALQTAEPALAGATGTLVLLSGDAPLLGRESLERLVAHHLSTRAAATVVTAVLADPHGYGRIVRAGSRIARIVEERDASPDERAISEINGGVYAFALDGLFAAIRRIAAENAQGEYYLPDLIGLYRQQGRGVETVTVPDPNEILGINSRIELATVSSIVRQQKNQALMASGVTMEDPATTYVDRQVEIGPDTVIRPGVSLEGNTTIGRDCEIHSGVRIVNSRIGDRVTIYNHSIVVDAVVGDGARVGPFAHLRQAAEVREGGRVGNFVELKNTVLGAGSKAMHLAYLGDATIGARVNVGAGTITCNYDGVTKNRTTIEDESFIGSDSQLVAPVTIGKGAYVGSGATIRDDVPPGALAVSAGKQRNIEGWVDKKRKQQAAGQRRG